MTTKKTDETKEVTEKSENNDCFIIMPIADQDGYKEGHFKRVYDDIFAPACRAAGFRPVRADDVAQTNLIHLDILQKLLESPMAICDLSSRNPNVLFELGLRQAFDKPTVIVREVGTPQIFDINMFRYTEYRNSLDYREVLADQKAIQKVLEDTKKAVEEGKSVNSIIKLLSITEAKLNDPSKFEEKDFLDFFKSEIRGIKDELSSIKRIYPAPSVKKDLPLYDTFWRSPLPYVVCQQIVKEAQSLIELDPVGSSAKILELLDDADSRLIRLAEIPSLSLSMSEEVNKLRKTIDSLKARTVFNSKPL